MSMKQINIVLEDQSIIVKAEKVSNLIWFQWEGFIYSLPYKISSIKKTKLVDETEDYKKQIVSDIPGQVVKMLVSVGQRVEENQNLLILSSMKMEYTLKASYSSQVEVIKIKEGDMVTAGQELILLSDVKS